MHRVREIKILQISRAFEEKRSPHFSEEARSRIKEAAGKHTEVVKSCNKGR